MKRRGYEKIGLEEILSIVEENGGELKFMFARQIAPYNIETILSLLYIKRIIDEPKDKVNKVILDILQWGNDNFYFDNIEKRIFVESLTLYGKKYYISAKKRDDLIKYRGKIGDIYLDVNKIIEMIEKTGLEYMKESLKYLEDVRKITEIKEGEEIKVAVNILDFWGLTTLYYIVEVSKHIFGINEYEIRTFYDKIVLVNKDKFDIFDISGYKLTFKYKEKELKFRVYDAGHINENETRRYRSEKNGYITLALYSGSGYILLEGDPEKEDQKIRELYSKASGITGYDILILVVDEEELIKRKIISGDSYVRLIDKNKNEYIINTIKETYGI